MNDIESRLQRYREQALAEIGAYGGVDHAVEKTASVHDDGDSTSELLEELGAVSDYLREGGEIEKVASYRHGGEQAMVGYSPLVANRLREPRALGAARTKEKNRPLQSTPGGSPTAVTRTEGKDQPSKTASIEELRDQILSQFGPQREADVDEGQEKTAGPKMDAVLDFLRGAKRMAGSGGSWKKPLTTAKSGFDLLRKGGNTAEMAGVGAGAMVPLAVYTAGGGLGAYGLAKALGGKKKEEDMDKEAAKDDADRDGDKPTYLISRFLTSPAAMGGYGALAGGLQGGLRGALGGAAAGAVGTEIFRRIAARGMEGRANMGGNNLRARERKLLGMDKEAGYDFPGGVETYSGKEGPTLNAPGTELISSNDRAVNYSKRDAKKLVVPSLRQELSEPAMSASTDPVAQRALSNASEAGVKTAGLAVGGIRGLLLGGVR